MTENEEALAAMPFDEEVKLADEKAEAKKEMVKAIR